MGAFSTLGKNLMLNSQAADRVQLHSGDPGASGTANVIAGTMAPATFGTSTLAERQLSADVEYTELAPAQVVTHFSVWNYNGGTPQFLGSSALTGDQAANAAGDYTLKATTTKLSLSDPA